jgi:hypothetical protein
LNFLTNNIYIIYLFLFTGSIDLLDTTEIGKVSKSQDGMCPGRDLAYEITGSEQLNVQLQDAFPGNNTIL